MQYQLQDVLPAYMLEPIAIESYRAPSESISLV
jgi:hypothetical protein